MASVAVLVPLRLGGDSGEIRARIWAWCEEWWGVFFSGCHLHFGDDGGEPFGRGPTINMLRERARQCCDPQVLIIADADTLVPVGQLRKAVAGVESSLCPWMLPYSIYFNLTAMTTERYLAQSQLLGLFEPFTGEYIHRLTDSVSGVVVMDAAFFDLIGGYDPGMRGWGYEDRVLEMKADTYTGIANTPKHVERISGPALHFEHGATEAERFQSPECKANEQVHRQYLRAVGRSAAMTRLIQDRAKEFAS